MRHWRPTSSDAGTRRSRGLREILLSPGMWAVMGYRARKGLYRPRLPRPIRLPLNVAAAANPGSRRGNHARDDARLGRYRPGVPHRALMPVSADIGPGFHITHSGYVVVGSRAKIGSNCTLAHGVTIGHAGGGEKGLVGCPTIGDRVYIGPGAIVIGPITVGDDALIGVGAVVTKSVPPRGVVAGNPARLLSRDGEFDLVSYPGMESDRTRRIALEAMRFGGASDPETPRIWTDAPSSSPPDTSCGCPPS